jgi:hypothetical protein
MAGAAGAPMAMSSARRSWGGGPGWRCCSFASGASSAGAGGHWLRGWRRIRISPRPGLTFGLCRHPSPRRRAACSVLVEVGFSCCTRPHARMMFPAAARGGGGAARQPVLEMVLQLLFVGWCSYQHGAGRAIVSELAPPCCAVLPVSGHEAFHLLFRWSGDGWRWLRVLLGMVARWRSHGGGSGRPWVACGAVVVCYPCLWWRATMVGDSSKLLLE